MAEIMFCLSLLILFSVFPKQDSFQLVVNVHIQETFCTYLEVENVYILIKSRLIIQHANHSRETYVVIHLKKNHNSDIKQEVH